MLFILALILLTAITVAFGATLAQIWNQAVARAELETAVRANFAVVMAATNTCR